MQQQPGGYGGAPLPPQPPQKGKAGKIALIVAGAAVLLFGGCAALMGVAFTGASNEIAKNTGTAEEVAAQPSVSKAPEPGDAAFKSVKVTSCKVDALGFPEVQGTVLNTGDSRGDVEVGFDVMDGDGVRIDAAKGIAEDLEPGQRGRFTATSFTPVDGGKIVCKLADVNVG